MDGQELDKHGMLTEEDWNQAIKELCASKAEEFRLLGYENVTGEDIWECIQDKYSKKGAPALHRIVNDILSLKTSEFMNWMTLSFYRKSKDGEFPPF